MENIGSRVLWLSLAAGLVLGAAGTIFDISFVIWIGVAAVEFASLAFLIFEALSRSPRKTGGGNISR